MLTLAVIDDHPVFRSGLRALIESQPDLSVLAEWGDAREAQLGAPEVQPDVYLVDVKLPGVDGITLTRELIRSEKRRRVLMLSMYDDTEHVAQAFSAGAAGYALKSDSSENTLDAIRTVAAGGTYVAPALAPRLVHGRRRTPAGIAALSAREHEVFMMVVRGMSGREIASTLFISPKTVESHRYKINRKLGVRSVAELIRFAALNGIPLR